MRVGAFVLAWCGVMHGFQAAPAKGSIEGQVMNVKAGSPLKKASVQLVMMNRGAGAAADRCRRRCAGWPKPTNKAASPLPISTPASFSSRPSARDFCGRITELANTRAAALRFW